MDKDVKGRVPIWLRGAHKETARWFLSLDRPEMLLALDTVGPGFDRLCDMMLTEGRTEDETEKALGWPKRTAGAALMMAMDRLTPRARAALTGDATND